ncbi:putative zinc metalloprotease, partial [Aureobasidium pullulans]
DDKDSKSTRKSEDFFSYEEEAPRLQEELDQKTRQVEELNEKITTLETDLKAAQNADQKARDELEKATKDQSNAKESQDKSDSDSEKKVAVLEKQKSDLEKQKLESEQKVSALQKQTSELEKKYNDSEDAINKIKTQLSQVDNVSESDKKPLETRIKSLGDKLSQASSDLKTANSQIEDSKAKATSAQDALNKLEKENEGKADQDASTKKASDADKKRLETLDSLVKTLKSQLADAESAKKSLQKDMDSMRNDLKKSKNGLKAAVEAASVVSTQDTSLTALRGQLKAAERERDDAYQMILACGHCKVPEQEASEVVVAESTSTATPDTAPPAQGAESGAAKKKNKNKKKKKGGAAAANKPAEASESAPPSSAPSPKPEEKSEETPTLQESVLSPEQLSAARAHIVNSLGQLAPGRNVDSEESSEKITELKTVIEQKDAEIKTLTTQIEKKEAAIDRLDAKLKGEEDLKEEIDDLREQLKDIGNDLCGARDQIKTLKAQKDSDSGERAEEMKQLEDRCKSLQKQCDDLKSEIKSKTEVQAKVQKELDELKQSSGSSSKELESKLAAIQKEKVILETTNKNLEKEAESLKSSHKDSSEKHKSLAAEFDEHKSTTSSLRTDLSAANELAQTRYKDLTALREHLNKIQPELTSLRQEASELKKAKEDLTASNGTLRKLEAKEKDLQSEISSYKTQAKEKDAEIKSLNDKVKQNAERTATLEEQMTRSQKDLQRAEKSQKEATESRDKLQKDLTKAQEESSKQREKLQNLEKQSPHPFGSVVSGDGFKRGLVKSGTDYSIFVDDLGMRGLDVAFMEPRARYHTNQDNARETSVESLWHMLSSALTTVQGLSSDTSDQFERPSGHEYGKHDKTSGSTGVWFDLFGRVFAVFQLHTLFALSVTLLVAGPIFLILFDVILHKTDKWYLFARKGYLHSSDDDEPVKMYGWRGFFRFPLIFAVASAIVVALAYLITKVNPHIIYSSEYAVWSMMLTAWLSTAWFFFRLGDAVRPSALSRAYVLIWLYALSWLGLVAATIGEQRMRLGSGYFLIIYNASVFLALLISYLEFFALPKKSVYVEQVTYASGTALPSPARSGSLVSHNVVDHDDASRGRAPAANDNEDADERTSLLGSRQTFTRYGRETRRPDENDDAATSVHVPSTSQAYEGEQGWSGSLPSWAWLLQFLILAPINLILIGQLGLLMTSALHQTPADGSPVLIVYLLIAATSVLLLLPLTPFIHRMTYHIPTFLMFVFIGTLIYNLVAFPFSRASRLKVFFLQQIDLDHGNNTVALTGLSPYLESIVSQMPSAADSGYHCAGPDYAFWAFRAGLDSCSWSGPAPNVVPTAYKPHNPSMPYPNSTVSLALARRQAQAAKYATWLDFNITRPTTNTSTRNYTFDIRGSNTRACRLYFSTPFANLTVSNAGAKAEVMKPGRFPAREQRVYLYSRDWDAMWSVNVTFDHEIEKTYGKTEGKVVCVWSDANQVGNVPAFDEVKHFMPVWSAVTKNSDGLVEGYKHFSL